MQTERIDQTERVALLGPPAQKQGNADTMSATPNNGSAQVQQMHAFSTSIKSNGWGHAQYT